MTRRTACDANRCLKPLHLKADVDLPSKKSGFWRKTKFYSWRHLD